MNTIYDDTPLEEAPAEISYDRKYGSLYVYVDLRMKNKKCVLKTKHVSDNVNLDFDAEGNLIGIEVLGVTIKPPPQGQENTVKHINEFVKLKIIVCPKCNHAVCWTSPRLPNYCPECGLFIYADLKGTRRECVNVVSDNARITYSA